MAACFSILFNVSRAATYYVSPNGSDSADGSAGTPWLTQQHALNTMVAGDTTIVKPGFYTRSYHWDQTVTNGTPSSRITMKATYGTVTNLYGLSIRNSWITYDGFIWAGVTNEAPTWNMDGDAGNVISIRAPNGNPLYGFTFQNCGLLNNESTKACLVMWGDTPAFNRTAWASNGPTLCVISNCVFYGCTNAQFVNISGLSNLVVNCVAQQGQNSDFAYCFGAWNTFRGIVCRNLYMHDGSGGYHPDFFQTFGSFGATTNDTDIESHDFLIEDCYVEHVEGGLCQLEYYPVPGVAAPPFGTITFRNNVFKDITASSIDTPGTKFYNNTFYNVPGGLVFTLYSPTNWSRLDQNQFPGAATNSAVINNLFINSGYVLINADTNFPYPYNVAVDYNYIVFTNGTGGWKSCGCPRATNLNWTTYAKGSGYYWAISGFGDPHGYDTGQNPKLVAGTNFIVSAVPAQFRPMLGSPLIDAGTNMSVWFQTDIEGNGRPFGSAYDIGCFEYDPSLKLHLDFNENFSKGKVADVSGNTNDGWSMGVVAPGNTATNWITQTAGINQGYAALFTTNGVMTNDPGQNYNLSTYIAVTNLNGFEYLTNGTISVWAWFGTNTDNAIRLFDNGFNQTYATGVSSNSWMLGRNYNSTLSFNVYPGSGGISDVLDFPDDVIKDQGSAPYNYGTASWHVYTITFDCNSHTIIGYYDGLPFQTNTLNLPYLRVYGCGSQRWLCIGAMSHDGTPQWGDDAYPNDGFMIGKLDDIRIYNRTLGPTAVQGLLLLGNQALQSGTAVLRPPSGFHVLTTQQ